jgi:hypothetical protein
MTIDKELIDFINQEKKYKKISNKQIILYFNKCIVKAFIDLDTKFMELRNKNVNIISGTNMFFHIFFILVCYTNNIKLTIFLFERSILLFTEFLIMSQDKKIIDEICFIPDITDAISFCYKKTIGPIQIDSITNTNTNTNTNYIDNNISQILNLLLYIYQLLYIEISNNDKQNFDDTIEIVSDLLEDIFIKILSRNRNRNINKFITNLIYKIIETTDTNILTKILIIKIILELMQDYINSYKFIKFQDFFNMVYNEHIDNKTEFDICLKKNKDFRTFELYTIIKNKINQLTN